MNDFEKDLRQRLQKERIPEPRSEMLWARIQNQILKKEDHPMIKSRTAKKWIVTACFSVAFIAAVGIYRNDIVHAATTLFKEVFGTIEEVQKLDPHADEQMVEKDLQEAKSVLTREEFKSYVALIQENTRIMKKAIDIVDGQQNIHKDRLSQEEKSALEKNEQQLRPLLDKISDSQVFSVAEVAKAFPFPVDRPSYVPAGYTLTKEEAKLSSGTDAKQLIVSYTYGKGEFGFTVRKSGILTGVADEYSLRSIENEEVYELNGNQVKYGKIGKNVTAMKMIVPARESTPEHQIFIIADVLSKQDVEKIALSMLGK